MPPKKIRLSADVHELPEELWIKIISFLDFKDAVRTSLISRRWRHMWKYIPNLVIDAGNVLSHKTNVMLKTSLKRQIEAGVPRASGVSMQITTEFIDVANFILRSHREPIESLVIRFFLEGKHAIYLDEWISCAIASRAKKLVLNLRSPYKERYNFPCHLFSNERGGGGFLEFLELKFCSLELPIQNFDGFKNLGTLRLESVHVSDGVIQNLLPKCVALKELNFISCNRLLSLQVPASLCKLEVLHISLCNNLEMVECYAPNLSIFGYTGDEVPLKVQVLEKARFCITLGASSYFIDHLPQAIASVKALKLYIDMELTPEVPNIPHFQDRFVNLRHLDLLYLGTIDVCTATAIINASPFLETFVVQIWGATLESGSEEARTMPECPHNHLKSITMDGFTGYSSQLELVRFLLANATQLEVATIQTSTRYSNLGSKLKVSPLKMKLDCKIFYELLRPLAPQHMKLSVL